MVSTIISDRKPTTSIETRKAAAVTPLRGERYATMTQNRAYWLIVSPSAGDMGFSFQAGSCSRWEDVNVLIGTSSRLLQHPVGWT